MKSTFLKVMGIIMTVLGAISLVSSLAAIPSYSYIGFTQIAIISLIQAALMFVAGIVGIKSSGDQHKAAGCIVWALLMIIMEIVGIIVQYASGYVAALEVLSYLSAGMTSVTMAISIPLGFVIPVLYFIAAYRFTKKNA